MVNKYLLIPCLCLIAFMSFGQEADQFLNPPSENKPRTWMHAMSGNMSKPGLTKDLEAMKEAGIGGLLLFNVTQGIPNGPVKYNSALHHEMITHAAVEAERLGLSFGVHNCDGWSASGGPWIKPEESMKMIVWSQKIVDGGKLDLILEEPTKREDFYRDIAVVAYPSLNSELDDLQNSPTLSLSDPTADAAILVDGKIDEHTIISENNGSQPWITYSYELPKTIRSVFMVFKERNGNAILQTSENGEDWNTEKELYKVRTGKSEWAINDHFEGITAKYFRLLLTEKMSIKEAYLTSTYMIDDPLGRTMIARTEPKDMREMGEPTPSMIIPKDQIRIIDTKLDANGRLITSLPNGKWTILRIGYSSTGAFNNPASDEGRGLEVDKFSKKHFKKHYDAFVKKVILKTKEKAPNALQYVEIDSYEMGGQNWTEGFDDQFKDRFGYDIIVFLPLITGMFVENKEVSEQVLYDFRAIICDLMTQNYFDYFTELCHKDGVQSYVEPYGFGPLNDLDIVKNIDIPMGEFWMNRPITMVKSAVSGAHIYGKPVISAESFTSRPEINWKGHPAMAKTSGDLGWTQGINEFMFHRFAHQANTHVEPGMTMNRWGFHIDRTQTWWENAGKAWFEYIARGSYMLRLGHPVADFLVFGGDDSPNSSLMRHQVSPTVPKWVNYDCVNSDVLINRLSIADSKLILPEGNKYHGLVLQNAQVIDLATAKRFADLAIKGIPIYGNPPQKLGGYQKSADEQKEFNEAIATIREKIQSIESWTQVYDALDLAPDFMVEQREDIDFAHRKTNEADLYFFYNPDSTETRFTIHFRVKNKIPELWNPMDGSAVKSPFFQSDKATTSLDIRLNSGESVFVVFKESRRNVPTLKYTETLSAHYDSVNHVIVDVQNNINPAIDLINYEDNSLPAVSVPESKEIPSPWQVSFGEKSYVFDELTDWSEHEDEEVRYFSGTAIYQNQFTLDQTHIEEGIKTYLNLGEVNIVAEVMVNGKTVGVQWYPPFQIDISAYVQEGVNSLSIAVTNQWSNKLIGDERFPPNDGGYQLGPHRPTDLTMPAWYTNNEPRPTGPRTTFTTAPFYSKDDPLMPSGLKGPVMLSFTKSVDLTPSFLPQINMPAGRIAFSSDGNRHDSDDWGATALSLALLKYAGLQERFVHYDYNNHIGASRRSWEEKMHDAAKGGAKRFGLDASKVFDNQTEREAATKNFVKEANRSRAEDPLWVICAGPMHTVYSMLSEVKEEKHRFIHLISHSQWNEKHSHGETAKTWYDLKNDLPKIRFHKIPDQNRSNGEHDFHSHLREWQWLKNSDNENWKWLYNLDDTWQVDSLETWKANTKEQFDVSDAGMTYWLISGGPDGGNSRAGSKEVKALFNQKPLKPQSADIEKLVEKDDVIVIEAESTESSLGQWEKRKSGNQYYVENASGEQHLEFMGNEPDTGDPNSPLTYTFSAPKNGNYRLLIMSSKRLEGARGDWCNDAFVKMDGDFTSATTLSKEELNNYIKYFQEGSKKTPERSWHWGKRAEKGRHEFHDIVYKLKKGEEYILTVAGRSQRFSIDYLVLYDDEKWTVDEAQKLFKKN